MGDVRDSLVVSKLFYFFFYGAFGSLFPLLSLYFKQLGMNASHVGLLVGIRPLVECISAPFWGAIADRYQRGRELLVFSVFCWIVFTSSLAFVRPSTTFCLLLSNRNEFVLESPGTTMREYAETNMVMTRLSPEIIPGLAPEILHEQHNITGYNKSSHKGLVKPPASTRVYKRVDVDRIFIILVVLVVIGEFFCAPAITLADACTLYYLGDAPEGYGKQRMYGSIGWALSMFAIGIALDYGVFSSHECGQTDVHEKDYTISFITFAVLMTMAMIVGTRFRFFEHNKQGSDGNTGQCTEDGKCTEDDKKDPKTMNERCTEDDYGDTNILRRFLTVHHISFLFVMWWFGFGIGLLFGFLFWHLQDLGGSPSIFGIASVVNHVSEIVAYFFTAQLIKSIGHIKVLYLGLMANIARFLYISWLKDPWLILPLEVVQGVSHAAVWAAATSYMALATPPAYKSSAQGILQGVHYGLGRACGALLGGIVITHIGTEYVFRAYGFSCGVVLVVFFAINRFLHVEHNETENTPAAGGGRHIPLDSLYSSIEGSLAHGMLGNNYGSTEMHQRERTPSIAGEKGSATS